MPTREDVKTIMQSLKRSADYDFFFNHLTSAEWLRPLLEEKLFSDPPPPVPHGELWSFPAWAASQYLARVARDDPKSALEVALAIPGTDNPRVIRDLLIVGQALPASEASLLTPRIVNEAKKPFRFFGPEEFINFASHLARNRLVGHALGVLEALIEFHPDPEREEKEVLRQSSDFGSILKPVTQLERHEVQEALVRLIPELARIDGVLVARILANHLNRGLELSAWEPKEAEPHDGSTFWRPAISEHRQNRFPRPLSSLVGALRDACECSIAVDHSHFPEIEKILGSHPWDVFRRLQIYLATRFPVAAGTMRIENIALNYSYFSELWYAHEYWELMADQFKNLSPTSRATVLGWVDKGPEGTQLDNLRSGFNGNPLTEEQISRRITRWRVSHLQAFHSDLPNDWKQRYEIWKTEVGEDEHLGFASWVGEVTSEGEASPLTKEAIAAMEWEELLQFLRSWEPPGSFLGPTRESLAGVLEQHIKEAPERYVENAILFATAPPVYASIVIRALSEFLGKKSITALSPILELVTFVSKTATKPSSDDPSGDWSYARLEAARFLDKLLASEPPPFELRESVWIPIYLLTNDPSPSVEDEARQGPHGMDAFSMSLNRTRGAAMHALFHYVSWIKRSQKGKPFKIEHAVPEAAKIILDRLDLEIEPTHTIRSVYGRFFPILYDLDPEFASALRAKVFPAAAQDKTYWEDVWNTYVVAWRPLKPMFIELRGEYARAVRQISTDAEKKTWGEPNESLGQHLAFLYAGGVVPLDDPLFTEFWASASPDLTARTLEQVGQALKDSNSNFAEADLVRLRALWDFRRIAWDGTATTHATVEAQQFGWWFSSGRFPIEWATEQMLYALKKGGAGSVLFMIVETFAELVTKKPIQALMAIRILAGAAQSSGSFFYVDNNVKRLLYRAYQIDSPEVRGEAVKLRDYLLALKFDQVWDVFNRLPPEES